MLMLTRTGCLVVALGEQDVVIIDEAPLDAILLAGSDFRHYYWALSNQRFLQSWTHGVDFAMTMHNMGKNFSL